MPAVVLATPTRIITQPGSTIYLSQFIQNISDDVFNELAQDVMFVWSEHSMSLIDINIERSGNKTPASSRYCQAPAEVIHSEIETLIYLSQAPGYTGFTFILNTYVQLDKTFFDIWFEQWENCNLNHFINNSPSLNSFQNRIFPGSTYGKYTRPDQWGAANVSIIIKNGQVKYHFKTFQAGMYLSRGCGIIPDIYPDTRWDKYALYAYPLYINGAPTNAITVDGKDILHAICVDAIAQIWDTHSIRMARNMTRIPLVIQGNSMAPLWWSANVFNFAFPQVPKYDPMANIIPLTDRTSANSCTITYGISRATKRDYPDTITFRFTSPNGQPMNSRAITTFDINLALLLRALSEVPRIIFADTSLDSSIISPQVGGVYRTDWNDNQGTLTLTKTFAFQAQRNQLFNRSYVQRADRSLYPANSMVLSAYQY